MRRPRSGHQWAVTFPMLEPSTGAGLSTLSRHLDPEALEHQLRAAGVPNAEIVEAMAALIWMRQVAVTGASRKEVHP